MEHQADIIIYFIKTFIMNLLVYYCFKKITNIDNKNIKRLSLIVIINILLVGICTYIEFFVNSFIALIIAFLVYGNLLKVIMKRKLGYSLIVTMISYAISSICLIVSAILTYIPYKLLYNLGIEKLYLNVPIVLIIQFFLIYGFFKIKRFKNGFIFLNDKLNNDITDIIIMNISTIVMIVYCLLGTIYDEITRNLLISFVILAFIMVETIQKVFVMYYKQKLQKETLKNYEIELEKKDKKIESLKENIFNVNKITHEFYNRQKALELLVKQNIDDKIDIKEDNTSKNILNMINTLNEEYSKEFDKIKRLPQLETTGIIEIDTMFKYMQSECIKNNIEFKLKVIGNVYPLINNIIDKSKLETLIGDHVRDAINAVISTQTENKEILVILGVKDQKYELSIYDTGKEFEIKTLLQLGLQPTTTNSDKGGRGIGFLTTFDTMKETKSSLIISEFSIEKENYFTKSVTIRFDDKNEYKICSYRASEIRKHKGNRNIVIEKI